MAEIEPEAELNENIKSIDEIGIKYTDINGEEVKVSFNDIYKNIDNYEKNANGNYVFKTDAITDYTTIWQISAYVKYTLNDDTEKEVNSAVKYYWE